MGQLVEAIWAAGILTVAIIFGTAKNPVRSIHMVPMCVMRHDGTTLTMDVWSDHIKRYLYHYPGSTCGTCATPTTCKEE